VFPINDRQTDPFLLWACPNRPMSVTTQCPPITKNSPRFPQRTQHIPRNSSELHHCRRLRLDRCRQDNYRNPCPTEHPYRTNAQCLA
jgi:hypothetical protein